jgi:transcriptional regulator with XRE-family HTH domain
MPTTSNFELGVKLRAHRERRGLTIAALADSIKVKKSLLDELERNDVSKWPPGIYGRALVREYAKSIGLPADDVVQQFVQLVSGSKQSPHTVTLSGGKRENADSAQLRLTLGGMSAPARRSIQVRVVAAAIELAFVLTTALTVALVSGVSGWITTAVITLIWYPVRGVLCGYDELYRILRLHRLSAVSRSTQIAHMRSLAAKLLSIGKTIVNRRVASAGDSLIVEPDVNPEPPSSTSIH